MHDILSPVVEAVVEVAVAVVVVEVEEVEPQQNIQN